MNHEISAGLKQIIVRTLHVRSQSTHFGLTSLSAPGCKNTYSSFSGRNLCNLGKFSGPWVGWLVGEGGASQKLACPPRWSRGWLVGCPGGGKSNFHLPPPVGWLVGRGGARKPTSERQITATYLRPGKYPGHGSW